MDFGDVRATEWDGGVFEDVLDDFGDESPWDWEPPIPDAEMWEVRRHLDEASELYHLNPTDFVKKIIQFPDPETRELTEFDFKSRPYLYRIHNTSSKRILLMTGRQVEKCVLLSSCSRDARGKYRLSSSLNVGDSVASLSSGGSHTKMTSSRVLWKSEIRKKRGVRITTRLGHVLEVAESHPVRTWEGWTLAGELVAKTSSIRGTRIGVPRRAYEFGEVPQSEARRRLTAYIIGDGYCGLDTEGASFTQKRGSPVLDDFRRLIRSAGISENKPQVAKTTERIRVQKDSLLTEWLRQDGLLGKRSKTKFLPDWVFDLPRAEAADFLNALWATDGHIKQNGPTKWSIEYASMSERLVRDVQTLLLKFGIPSRVRKNWPAIYKKRGEDVQAYILRVETWHGVRTFIREIGALGKAERQELPSHAENNNRDTYPEELSEIIRWLSDRYAAAYGSTLHAAGLRRSPKYALTRGKLREYVQFFTNLGVEDPKLDFLRDHLESDVYWDEVVSVEDMGEQDCVDFEIEGHHNWVVDGVITHNSTTLAIKVFIYSCLIPHFKALYVSPSSTQTKQFSNDRIKELLATCPSLKTWYPDNLVDNVFEKKAINRSQIILRYAFLNADRCRGISADGILIDEFQDILLDNIPVIEEAASHSPFKYFIYSGTPKSEDNPIQQYWANSSTQNEWVIPCERHGTPKDPGSWHWNILGEANIGRKGVICDKCGHPINPLHPQARWVQTATNLGDGAVYEGFRIPQLMVPWLDWDGLLAKYRDYPRAQFMNEVLGRSFDSGQRPLTTQDIRDNCLDSLHMSAAAIKEIVERTSSPIYAGIDWGQDSTKSYTVLTLATYIEGHFTTFFAHRFEGVETDPQLQVQKIKRFIRQFNIRRVGVDYGGGHHPNSDLLKEFGNDRILRFQYSQTNNIIDYDRRVERYKVHKHEVLSAIFNAIKSRKVFRFPNWEEWKRPFGSDMLAVFSEYNERTRLTEYKKSVNATDDTLHAVVFSFLASYPDNPRPELLRPSVKHEFANMVKRFIAEG